MERQLLLPLLITAMICKASHAITHGYYLLVENVADPETQPLNMTWSEALYKCRTGYSDMLTLDIMTSSTLNSVTDGLSVVWMGLQRDKRNDSEWHWIDTTIANPTTDDFSQNLEWTDQGNSSHCAYVNSDSTWSSKRCAEKHPFYCTSNDILYNRESLSWQDARNLCHDNKGELPTITENRIEWEHFMTTEKVKSGWIGLYRVGGDTWMWATGEILSSAAWGIGEPVTNDCGAFDGVNKKWQSYPCDTPLNVLCFVDTLVVVHERKTWEEALEHCKSLEIQHNLVTVESELDYIRVGKRIYMATEEVWTGLRFLGGQWWWVNGEPLNNQMLPSCPEPLSHCGAFSKTNNDILLMDCTKKLHFICQRII